VAISRKLLNADESVVLSTRTHGKALLVPALILMAIAAVAGFVISFTFRAGSAAPLLQVVVGLAAAYFVFRWVLRSFLRWLTTTYTVTNRRLITRSGILTRRGHDIPLDRISDVSYERDLIDRVFGSGTLLVSVASEQYVELHDIPRVEQVHLQIQDLLYDDDHDWYSDDRPTQRIDEGR
jgi:uncharacterized membrane protein YdbT with pleckstrin-like domain